MVTQKKDSLSHRISQFSDLVKIKDPQDLIEAHEQTTKGRNLSNILIDDVDSQQDN